MKNKSKHDWYQLFSHIIITYHCVHPKLNMASHLFVHNILALIGKWWAIHHGSIGHRISKEAANSRLLTTRWHFSHIITRTVVVLVVHGPRTGVIKKKWATGRRCSGSGFCCMDKNIFFFLWLKITDKATSVYASQIIGSVFPFNVLLWPVI